MRKNLFIIIAGILVICVFGFDLLPNVYLDTGFKIAIYLLACILVFMDMKLKNRKLEKEEEKEQNRKKYVTIIFIIYACFLVSLLLLDSQYRRFGDFQNSIRLFSKEHFEYFSNLIPFRTIYDFLARIGQGTINISIVFTNLIGNLLAFAPFGILIPIIFKEKFSNVRNFTFLMIGIVLVVEFIQFVTMYGAFDVDDLILNVVGAVIVFGLMKVKGVRKFVDFVLK